MENLQVMRQYEKKQKDQKSIQFNIQHLIHLSESLSWIGWWMDFWSLGSTSKHFSSRACTVYFGSVFPRPELNERIWEIMCRMQYVVSQCICILKYCFGAYLLPIDMHNVQENTTTPQLQTCSSSAADSITWIWNDKSAQRFLHFCWELKSIWDSTLFLVNFWRTAEKNHVKKKKKICAEMKLQNEAYSPEGCHRLRSTLLKTEIEILQKSIDNFSIADHDRTSIISLSYIVLL
jgi:hypothetical protein